MKNALKAKRLLIKVSQKKKTPEDEDIFANLESSVNKYITLAAAEEEDHVKMKSIVVKMNSYKRDYI